MSSPATLKDSPKYTCLPGSADGVSHCGSPDGQMIGLFGPHLAPARISHSAESRQALKAVEIFGPTRSGSGGVNDDRLTAYLVNRLSATLSGMTGPPMTWKVSATPAGRLLFRLARSERTTNGSGSGFLPTPRHSMGTHGIAWSRAERGEHRHNLEDYLACMWLADGGVRTSGLNVNPHLCAAMMGYPKCWVDSAMRSFRK